MKKIKQTQSNNPKDDYYNRYHYQKKQVKKLTKLLDQHLGTPCEQVRHQEAETDLKEKIELLETLNSELKETQGELEKKLMIAYYKLGIDHNNNFEDS